MKFSFQNMNHDPSMSEYTLPAGYYKPNDYYPGYIQNPRNIHKQILCDLELEKKKISEQLLVASNAHKLVMEAGARIELLLERQMTILKDDHFPFISPGSQLTRYDNQFSNMLPYGVGSVKDRFVPPQGFSEYGNLPLTRYSESKLVEKIPNLEISNDIIPAKSPGLFGGRKCEAETPPPKEWNCAICKLTFSNAQNLNNHIHGGEHNAVFRRFFKIEMSNGDHELEQNANPSKMDIDESEKENGNSEVQFPSLTNSNEKLLTLFEGADYENVMNDSRSREKNSGEHGEVAQNNGICAEKILTDKKGTNRTSAQIGGDNDISNLEQNTCESGKESGNLSANLVKTGDRNACDSNAHHNDSSSQLTASDPRKIISGAKRKAEEQPLEAVGASKISSAKSTKIIFEEKAQGGSKKAAEIRKTLVEEMRHKAAERRERFGTELVPKDSNKRKKIAENHNFNQVIQNSNELKKISIEKNESAEAATLIIKDSKRENCNPEVHALKIVNSKEKLLAPSISQNGGSQVGKAKKVEQEVTQISPSKDKEIHKLKEAKPVGYVSGLKHKAGTQTLEKIGPTNVYLAGATKKPKKEFRCELCQVFVSVERTFNQHLQGKRHKAAERRANLVNRSLTKDNNNNNNKQSLVYKRTTLGSNSLSINNNNNKLSVDPKNLQSANNSLGKIAEKHNNSKLVRLKEFREVITPKISQTCPESIQIDKVIQNSEAFTKEIKVKNEVSEEATNVDSSEKENGSSAVQMVKLVTSNEQFMAFPKVLTVESEQEKTVDSHKKKQNQLEQVTPCVDKLKKETIDKNELALLVAQSNICTQVTLDSTKGNGILTDTVLNADNGNSYESIACKNKFALLVTPNTSDSDKDNRKLTDTMQRTGDGKSMVGAYTKEVKNDHRNGKRQWDKLLEVAKNDESQAEDVSNEEKETTGFSLNISDAQENCNLEQNGDEPEQETEMESKSQLIGNTTNKSEKETDNLTAKTLKIGNKNKRFKFVCTVCKVGHNTERVMIAHNRRRSHLEKLRQLAENRVPVCVEKGATVNPENEKEKNQQ